MSYGSSQKVQKVMVQPINLIFRYPFYLYPSLSSFGILRYLQNRTRVSVWLYENVNTRIEGHITGMLSFKDFCVKFKWIFKTWTVTGFDEYMNLVLDDACEVHLKRKTEKVLIFLHILKFYQSFFVRRCWEGSCWRVITSLWFKRGMVNLLKKTIVLCVQT